jgi:hypothetical protein
MNDGKASIVSDTWLRISRTACRRNWTVLVHGTPLRQKFPGDQLKMYFAREAHGLEGRKVRIEKMWMKGLMGPNVTLWSTLLSLRHVFMLYVRRFISVVPP